MPLNKLDNFLKNTEGRILYVNPNDLDSTDSIENEGNSLARPFKTIQRALLEAARFSWVRGNNNDLVEKTTILLFPGEHIVDNRPGYGIYDNSGAKAVSRSGSQSTAASVLSLGLDSNFDLTQEDNILYKFNSWYGGVVVPRGTSIVGLDLRKTKIRPLYVPNPTDPNVPNSAIFRITGACYFWQFSLFDGDSSSTVYVNPNDFSDNNKVVPSFSHHKLTCFEFCDGVNNVILPVNGTTDSGLTDLNMYYSKVSNAYNSIRGIESKYPENPDGFTSRNPEWEIVGAFAADPLQIASIISGNGSVASSLITVTTALEHNLNEGTPIKINGVGNNTGSTNLYNISTVVQNVLSPTSFTYLLLTETYATLDARPSVAGATVTVETDTVSGASPYIFNCSLRSVWGMNGLHADGSKASGFRSTVVAQFTAVSLQKDDRAFTKYNESSRTYVPVPYTSVSGAALASGSSQTDKNYVYHLDPDAVYRQGWESSHIKVTNDAFIQIVSVFAIGFNKHFDAQTGGDASITNSNSNFGQISLSSSGFKKEAFDKDNKAFITSIIPPRAITGVEEQVEWVSLDVGLTTSRGIAKGVTNHLYLYGYTSPDNPPASITQGYKVGAKLNDKLYLTKSGVTYSASIYMCDNVISKTGFTNATGTTSSVKTYTVTGSPTSNAFNVTSNTGISTGESVKIISDDGDLPENIVAHQTYYTIKKNSDKIKLASSYSNALQDQAIDVYLGTNLKILSRVSDKEAGDLGSPIQYDAEAKNWFISVNSNNEIYQAFLSGGVATFGETSDAAFVKRISDGRSLDEKLYKFRVVIPKELSNAKNPESGFIIQESSTTGAGSSVYFTRTSIGRTDYDYDKNPRFISTCRESAGTVTVISELPHNINIGETILVKNIKSSQNTDGDFNKGYNGTFAVTGVTDANTFTYTTTNLSTGVAQTTGTFIGSQVNTRDENLPRFERNDWGGNLFVYRNEVISPYIQDKQDGIYHLYVLNANNQIADEFTNLKFGQLPSDLYPQLDRDNVDDNPRASKTYAKRAPIGEVVTNDLKKSITRESADLMLKEIGIGLPISSVASVTGVSTISFSRFHGLSGIVVGTISNSGSTYNSGTYYNVKLLNGSQSGIWSGATAKVVVSPSGTVSSVDIISPGSGYGASNLYFDQNTIGAGDGNARYTITTSGITTNVGDVVQVTGTGTTSDGYYRISSVPSSTAVALAKTVGDPTILAGQYAFVVGPSATITSAYSVTSGGAVTTTVGITSFKTSTAHGLLSGNKFRVTDSNNNNLGDFIVKDKLDVTSFTAVTNKSIVLSSGYILKHGLSANDGSSGVGNENLGTRGVSFYDNQRFTLTASITNISSTISISSTGIGTDKRLPLGSYIQIDNEIMRVISSNNTTQATVERGVFGSLSEEHSTNSLIRKINPVAVEFRRPSIVRASGHTFEYLGYGPGNYSTGLPQVQVKTLSEAEQFFSQAQERSGGVVVYTGMNNSGDFFNGNTKTSASSGEVISYDIPTPTVTGETSKKLSVVYDEVTIKDRLVVEGGISGTVLSQFDGPVTFNQDVRVKGNNLIIGTDTKFKVANTNADAFNISGGMIVDKEIVANTGVVPDTDLGAYLGTSSKAFSEAYVGKIKVAQTDDNTINTSTGNLKLSAPTGSTVAIQTNTTITGNLDLSTAGAGSAANAGRIKANYLDVPNISPIGSIIMWPGAIDSWPTSNWKMCNGQSLLVSQYSDLFSLIGYTYGGSGASFNLPNLLERFVVGAGGENTSVSGSAYNLASTGGARDAVVVSHTHTANTLTNGTHQHLLANSTQGGTALTGSNYVRQFGDYNAQRNYQLSGSTTLPTLGLSSSAGGHTHTVTVDSSGSSATDANLPPYIGLIYIIRVL